MEVLEQRLFAIEETIGNISPTRKPLYSEVAELREHLKNLKMDMVLRAPADKLRELHKEPPLEETLSLDEKLFIIQYHQPLMDKHMEELDEMERLSKVVFESEVFTKIPDVKVLDDVRKSIDELNDEIKKAHDETMHFLIEQSKILKETTDAWRHVKDIVRPKPQL